MDNGLMLKPSAFLEILRDQILVRGLIEIGRGGARDNLTTTIAIYHVSYDLNETPSLHVLNYVNLDNKQTRREFSSAIGLSADHKKWLTVNWELTLANIVLGWSKKVPPWTGDKPAIVCIKDKDRKFKVVPPSSIYIAQQLKALSVRLAYEIEKGDLVADYFKKDGSSAYELSLKGVFYRLSSMIYGQNIRLEDVIGSLF